MKHFLKENLAILLAFSMPIGFLVIVLIATYLPSFLLTTDYNFVYAACIDKTYDSWANCDESYYIVENGKLSERKDNQSQPPNNDDPVITAPRIFLHNTKKNEGREITLEEAKKLSLSELVTSPDGVIVSNQYDRGDDFFFLFQGSSSYGHYLTKGKGRSKLNLIGDNDSYSYSINFQFVGWVLPGRN